MALRWQRVGMRMGCVVLLAGSAGAEVTVEGTRIIASTPTVTGVFDGTALVSLKPGGSDVEFMHSAAPGVPLDVHYATWQPLGTDKHQTVAARKLSNSAVLVEVKGADSTRQLLIATDSATGDICVTPSSVTARRAVQAVRWTVGFQPDASLVLPIVNGQRVDVARPFPGTRRFPWPSEWNAQLAIAELGAFSCMVHSEDRELIYKALNLHREGDRRELGFEMELPGPLWDQRAAGGVTWRINVYKGDWQVPARRYREWMARAYDLAGKRAGRPQWVEKITLSFGWANPSIPMLEAIAAVHPPDEVLIHLSNWRTDKYDVNYPEYSPREDTLAYMKKAREMGFHVMPHFNYFSVYNQHPFFQEVRDFQVRDPRTNTPQGWYWPPDTHDYTRMAYIHPGLSLWRNHLIEKVLTACDGLETDVTFIDQTLCTWNADNAMLEGGNTIAGMQRLQEEFASIRPDLVLCGEGLNEISFQRECFAQAHIYDGWSAVDQKQVDAVHPICAFLWAGHTRLVGYYKLNPDEPMFDATAEVYARMGAIPTLITNNPAHLREPGPRVQRILDAAKGRASTQPAQ